MRCEGDESGTRQVVAYGSQCQVTVGQADNKLNVAGRSEWFFV